MPVCRVWANATLPDDLIRWSAEQSMNQIRSISALSANQRARWRTIGKKLLTSRLGSQKVTHTNNK